MSYLKQSDRYNQHSGAVTGTITDEKKGVSVGHLSALLMAAFKVVLLTIVLLGAFLFPFMMGVQTSRMKAETSQMRLEIHEMEEQISEYNQKIAAYSDVILLNQEQVSSE